MLDHLTVVADESARFEAALRAASLGDGPSPEVATCPGWSLADLAWHLIEVQHFWAAIVEGRLDDPSEVEEPVRPDDAQLADRFAAVRARLVTALGAADPETRCWSWFDGGWSVGWVRRRQAHEVLIHRIDAESAVGRDSPVDPALAADGVDEMLTVMLDANHLPDWARYEHDGTGLRLRAVDCDRSWDVTVGRYRGTDPSGRDREGPAIRIEALPDDPTAELSGPADELNRWLWGRGPLAVATVDGDRAVLDRLRAAAAESTQ